VSSETGIALNPAEIASKFLPKTVVVQADRDVADNPRQ